MKMKKLLSIALAAIASAAIAASNPDISKGHDHTLFLKADGTVWVSGTDKWGYGPLGLDSTTQVNSPTRITSLVSVEHISTANWHNVAVKDDGTVWAWGNNEKGQLCLGDTSNRTAPVQVPGLTDVKTAYAASFHSVFLKKDGTAWTCGYDQFGQLGNNGWGEDSSTPVQVEGLDNIKYIVPGINHTFAVSKNGSIWAWGYNFHSQLGTGTTENAYTPVQLQVEGTVKVVAADIAATMVVLADGSVWAWGANQGYTSNGLLGTGSVQPVVTLPEKVLGLSEHVTDVYAGFQTVVAKTVTGKLYGWGNNTSGQLALGADITDENQQIMTPTLLPVTSSKVLIGMSAAFFLKENGSVFSAGFPEDGALGTGNTTGNSDPARQTIAVEVGSSKKVMITSAAANKEVVAKTKEVIYTLDVIEDMTINIDNVKVIGDNGFVLSTEGLTTPCASGLHIASEPPCQLKVVFTPGATTGHFKADIIIPTPDTFTDSILLQSNQDVSAEDIVKVSVSAQSVQSAISALPLNLDTPVTLANGQYADFIVNVPADGVLKVTMSKPGSTETPALEVNNGFTSRGVSYVAAPSRAGKMTVRVFAEGNVTNWTLKAEVYTGVKTGAVTPPVVTPPPVTPPVTPPATESGNGGGGGGSGGGPVSPYMLIIALAMIAFRKR